jgi:hypothetical protein
LSDTYRSPCAGSRSKEFTNQATGTHERRGTILALISSIEVVEVDTVVLERAAQPMPTELGALDATDLATALLWKDMTGADLVMAIHSAALGLGAHAHGLAVVGFSLS